jgi:hypothetical protein
VGKGRTMMFPDRRKKEECTQEQIEQQKDLYRKVCEDIGESMTRKEAKQHIGKGWYGLIDKAFDMLPSSVLISDVKAKFGGLRIEITHADMNTLDAIEQLEEESLTICEICGEPGEPTRNNSGWIKTVCNKHRYACQRSVEERIIELFRSASVKWDKKFHPVFCVSDRLLKEYGLTREQVEGFLHKNYT